MGVSSRKVVIVIPLLAVIAAVVYGVTRDSVNAPAKDALLKTRDIPPFSLKNASGAEFTPAQLSGRWSLVFSGYTSCPDICPVTLSVLSQVTLLVQPQLGARTPQTLFVSMDPARDTPQVMAAYVTHFNPAPIAVLGPPEQLLILTDALGFVSPRTSEPIAHSSTVALVNPQGQLHALFRAPHDATSLAQRVVKVIDADT